MSQEGVVQGAGGSGAPPIETITGNSGGPVGPDAAFNINFPGNTTMGITVVGNAGLNTLTIVASQATTTQFGTIKTATNAQAIAGTDANNAITAASLAAKLGTQTQFGLPIGAGTSSAISWTAAPTDGQLLIGSTGLTPVLATLTAGTGIGIANGAGSITITATSVAVLPYTRVNNGMSPYTVLATDQYLGVDTSGGAVTIRLPNAPSTGRTFYVKDFAGTSAGANITVTTVGGAVNIDGAVTYIINSAYQAIAVLFNSTGTYEIF